MRDREIESHRPQMHLFFFGVGGGLPACPIRPLKSGGKKKKKKNEQTDKSNLG